MKHYTVILVSLALILFLAGCSEKTAKEDEKYVPKAPVETAETKIIRKKEFTLIAQEGIHQFGDHTRKVLTYGGSIPGPEIRVTEGEKVKITLQNHLKDDNITIHWHGYPVPNPMDGVPGVTQNSVKPGESFTYEFTATIPGTYWYHSHQHSAYQVDMGLYGAFIVEEKKPKIDYDLDKTLVLDEWSTDEPDKEAEHDHSSVSMDDMYDLYTINGKIGKEIDPIKVKKGDKVRLRFIHAGFISKYLQVEGHEYKVIALDGQAVNEPSKLKNTTLKIGTAERYDIEFTADNPGNWNLSFVSDNPSVQEKLNQMTIPIVYEDIESTKPTATETQATVAKPEVYTTFDYMRYGIADERPYSLHDTFDVEYEMNLNTSMHHHTFYTINNAIYPLTEDILVKSGDLVKVTMTNLSPLDEHPMHLHGHFFQILSKNGEEIKGSAIKKDTIILEPHDTVTVAFRADNKGNWMFHCHELHHASAGMVTQLLYTDFTPDPSIEEDEHNSPE